MLTGGRLVAGLGVALFAAVFWWGMLSHDPTVVLEDLFDGRVTELSLNIGDPPGWISGAPLILGPGESGHLVYDISQPPEARVTAEVEVADVAGIEARARMLWRVEDVQGEESWPLSPGGNEIDLTPHIPASGLIRLALEARMPLGTPPRSAFEGLVVTQRLPREIHWSALLFLFVTGAMIWVGLPALVAAEWRRGGAPAMRGLSAIAVLVAVGLLMLLPQRESAEGGHEPLLVRKKFFDDSRAISNAALLVANGGDTSQMYFRSRERPSFAAHTVPLCLLFPQRFIRASHSPSDFHARLWREFDRDDSTFGSFRHLEISLVGWVEAIACALVWALIWRRMGCGAGAAWLAALLAALAFTRALDAPGQVSAVLTLIWNLLINGAAVLATLRLLDRPRWGSALVAGMMIGLAALTKPTAMTSFLPLGVLAVGRLWSLRAASLRSHGQWIGVAVLVALALVLWWFEGLMEGLVAELSRHPNDFERILELHPEFPRRSWATAAHALWTLAGPGWPLVAGGLLIALRRPTLAPVSQEKAPALWHVSAQARTFALLWAVSGLLAFLMPFIFPRFLKYMAPGLGLLATAGAIFLISGGRSLLKRPIRSDTVSPG
jgi:hypothetical protein